MVRMLYWLRPQFRVKPSSLILTDADDQGNVRADTVRGTQDMSTSRSMRVAANCG
jgi:hypothetical protein